MEPWPRRGRRFVVDLRRWLAASVLLVTVCAEGAGASAPDSSRSAPGALVWVALENANRVVLVNVRRRRVVDRFRAPGGPHNITVAPDGTVGVALWGSDRIGIVRRGRIRFARLGGAPHDIKADGRVFVVANQGDERVDFVTVRHRVRGHVRLVADPHDLAIDPRGRRAWVTLEGRDELAVIDLDRKKLRRYVSTGQSPHDLLFAPDGRLWVTDWEGELHVFERGDRVKTIRLGVEAHHLAFTPNGRFGWITDHGAHRVFVLSVRRVKVVKTIRFPGAPHHVAITSDGRFAVVADHENARLLLYDAKTFRRVGRIRVGAGPHGVWAVPA